MREIQTFFVYPPIPIRKFDWVASFTDDDGEPCGFGSTEQEAIEDLINNFGDL
jgi:hypothetical protein